MFNSWPLTTMNYPILTYRTWYTENKHIDIRCNTDGFPLSKLLIVTIKNNLWLDELELLCIWLQPINVSELSYFQPTKIQEYQRNYYLLGLSERLGINQSQLLQLWNYTLQRL